MREKSGVLRGKTRFDEYRVVTNLTLDRAAIGIAKHYEMQIKAVEELRGRIPHTVVIVWTGAELKVKISEGSDLGSVRPNLHTAVYDGHRPASDSLVYDICQEAAVQIWKMSRRFHGVMILFTGCAEVFHLDSP